MTEPSPPLRVATPEDLLAHVGDRLGPTDWNTVTQDRIDVFAEATGDHQWIHVDIERANNESPFGGPIAHGYLTLSLVNLFLPELLVVQNFSAGINIGLERVRFPAPVPSGSKLRARGEVLSASEAKGGVQVVVRVTVEIDGSERPACVADTVSRFLA
ncbi:MAG: MaoC family dehydratase [Microthrixaceae bacterium]